MIKHILLASILALAPKAASSQILAEGPPSILPQCMDPPQPLPPGVYAIGPTARARECTREICAEPDFMAKVHAYAKSESQSEADAKDALTCITRQEQDQRKE